MRPETIPAVPSADTVTPAPRPRRLPHRVVFGGAAALLLLALILALGPGGGWRAWERRRAARLTVQARGLLAAGDPRGGGLAAARALQLDPTSADACRLLADSAAGLGRADEALRWARQAVAMRPDIPGNQLQVASLALQFDRLPAAAAALDAVTGWARDLPGYHALRGTLAMRQSRPQEAVTEFAAARHGDPDNEGYLLNEKSLQLTTRPGDAEARTVLARLAADGRDRTLRTSARKAMLADDLLTDNGADLRLRGRDLEADPTAGLDEWLPYLEFLTRDADPRAGAALERLLGNVAATRDPGTTTTLLGWMTGHGLAPAAATWGRSLPGPLRADVRGVRPAVANALAAARDWTGLREFCGVSGENWHDHEFLRLGYLALGAGNLRDDRALENEWNAARTLAENTPGAVRALAEIFVGRGAAWNDRLDALLWGIADGVPGPDTAWALDTLNRRGLAGGDSRTLLRVAERTLALNPGDVPARSTRAALWLLRNENVEAAATDARQLYEGNRTNPAIATTHAFALVRRGQPGEAVAVLRGLPPEVLREPAAALVYGLALEATGDREAAAPHLTLARDAAAGLLPEERALLNGPSPVIPAAP